MGDAISAQAASLPAGLDLVAGYVTGSPDIQWTAADFARFPGVPHVTIDQGFTGSPVPSANVIDVEAGAWTAGAAVAFIPAMTSPRPTIYSGQSDAEIVWSLGYKGDYWLAWPGWTGTAPPAHLANGVPVPPGVRIVAVQNVFAASYDLSVVFDPFWPEEDPMAVVAAQPGWKFCAKCGSFVYGGAGAPAAGYPCAGGGTHDVSVSGDYSALVAE